MRARATARQLVPIGRLAGPIRGRFGASALASAGPARGVPEDTLGYQTAPRTEHSATTWYYSIATRRIQLLRLTAAMRL